MSKAIQRFEDYWRQMDLTPRDWYIHPADMPHLNPEFQLQFQLQLLPIPVIGNLREAEAIILMLNAGFGPNDLAWQRKHRSKNEAMVEAQRANIRQRHSPANYPFYDFHPLFRTHPGAGYWKGGAELAVPQRQMAKLRGVATELVQNWRMSAEEVHRYLSRRVAVLEWCPYRSAKFKRTRDLKKIPSCIQVQELARGLVQENQKLVIVTRHINAWGYSGSADSMENLVVYDSRQGSSASLTMNSAGGKAILQRLLRAGPKL